MSLLNEKEGKALKRLMVSVSIAENGQNNYILLLNKQKLYAKLKQSLETVVSKKAFQKPNSGSHSFSWPRFSMNRFGENIAWQILCRYSGSCQIKKHETCMAKLCRKNFFGIFVVLSYYYPRRSAVSEILKPACLTGTQQADTQR